MPCIGSPKMPGAAFPYSTCMWPAITKKAAIRRTAPKLFYLLFELCIQYPAPYFYEDSVYFRGEAIEKTAGLYKSFGETLEVV